MLEQLENGSYVHPDDPGEPVANKPRISITDEEGRFLHWVTDSRRVLEIGTGLGVSTLWMYDAAELHTVDIDPWVWDHVWPDLAAQWELDDDQLVFHQSRGSVRGPFDVVFIDGEHSVEQTRKDAQFALALCRGLVVAHDAHMPKVWEGLQQVREDWQVIDTTYGLATTWSWSG